MYVAFKLSALSSPIFISSSNLKREEGKLSKIKMWIQHTIGKYSVLIVPIFLWHMANWKTSRSKQWISEFCYARARLLLHIYIAACLYIALPKSWECIFPRKNSQNSTPAKTNRQFYSPFVRFIIVPVFGARDKLAKVSNLFTLSLSSRSFSSFQNELHVVSLSTWEMRKTKGYWLTHAYGLESSNGKLNNWLFQLFQLTHK